ncbi:DNA-directed RNA polymerase I subunit [Starmerella bacillaris]|uniref:DNA-directed RNA polymerase I subunit n=1 Tax=Starmerella bacillaris TaxID=1247836 RepID=A0AAV5RD00_STABA|nr:DNA-directed RNA polymerase I subunit [Starmerella bacillaris]
MPAVLRTPGVDVSQSVFKVYTKPSRKRKSGKQIVEGKNLETPNVQYTGTQVTDEKYCLVIKDNETGKVELVEVPLFDIQTKVFNEHAAELANTIKQSGVENWQQRTNLGEAFGTKKAKTAINDVSRNRIDADMLEGFEDAIVDNVSSNIDISKTQSSSKDNKGAGDIMRPIPPFDLETHELHLVYNLSSIVPDEEWDALTPLVDDIINADSQDSRIQLLPYGESDFVNERVAFVINEGVNVIEKLQVLVYISFLMAVYKQRRCNNRRQLVEKINNIPNILFDGVCNRFTVPRAGRVGTSKDRSFVFDPFHTDKLLCYMFALMLHSNNFMCDVTPLSHELSVPGQRTANLFRNLGCMVRVASKEEAKVRELTPQQASSYRIATLQAPLVLPDMVRRKRN